MEGKIVIYNKVPIYTTSEYEYTYIIRKGGRVLSQDELVEYGIAGYEKYVTPLNTIVRDDGTVVFTQPSLDEIMDGPRKGKLEDFDNAMNEIDQKMHRSISDLLYALINPSAISENSEDALSLENSKNIFVQARALQEENRTLREKVLTAQTIDELSKLSPKTVEDMSIIQ